MNSLDRSRPLLPKFDRLTDEQMREAFRSIDPWATSFWIRIIDNSPAPAPCLTSWLDS